MNLGIIAVATILLVAAAGFVISKSGFFMNAEPDKLTEDPITRRLKERNKEYQQQRDRSTLN